MKRRTALRSLALAVGGTLALPAWAKAWNTATLAEKADGLAMPDQEALLAELVDTIIPTTDTPGAKGLGVHLFMLTMLADCYDKQAQDRFFTGLKALEEKAKTAYGKPFGACSLAERLEFLHGQEAEAQLATDKKNAFFPFLKNMTIQGYLNSEFVMRDVFKYELVPARYHGCVPVKISAKR